MPTNTANPIFVNFLDYWYYAKTLSETQREIIYTSLPYDQRAKLEKSYEKGGWHDVIMRNKLNEFIDTVKKKFGYDLLSIRTKVMSNKSVYVPRKFWRHVVKELGEYRDTDIYFIIGDIKPVVTKVNPNAVLLLRNVGE